MDMHPRRISLFAQYKKLVFGGITIFSLLSVLGLFFWVAALLGSIDTSRKKPADDYTHLFYNRLVNSLGEMVTLDPGYLNVMRRPLGNADKNNPHSATAVEQMDFTVSTDWGED